MGECVFILNWEFEFPWCLDTPCFAVSDRYMKSHMDWWGLLLLFYIQLRCTLQFIWLTSLQLFNLSKFVTTGCVICYVCVWEKVLCVQSSMDADESERSVYLRFRLFFSSLRLFRVAIILFAPTCASKWAHASFRKTVKRFNAKEATEWPYSQYHHKKSEAHNHKKK